MASMMDLVGKNVKIGKTSITIKDDDNKTRGIVKNMISLADAQPNKQFEFGSMLRKLGIYSVLSKKAFVIKDGTLYAIRNTKNDEFKKKIMERNGFEYDKEVWAEQAEAYKKLAENGISVIECRIL